MATKTRVEPTQKWLRLILSIRGGKETRDAFLKEVISQDDPVWATDSACLVLDCVRDGAITEDYEIVNALAVAACFAWFGKNIVWAKELIAEAESVCELQEDRDFFAINMINALALNLDARLFRSVFA